ncbi:hypothetical protein CKAH01_16821 [Colletotrichum kahawae]|uniref:Developmental regulatory protein wetA n=1 Tax=Colletotrichum kahawae TaxID=34407 RepID=A0AAD9YBS1_COLKA|nr:hypothetical protein CKAH01_16821 [Colletotrichum kahawae]
MFHPSYSGPQDCTAQPSTSMVAWNSTPRDISSIDDLHLYLCSVNDNASWACAMSVPRIDSQHWAPLPRQTMAPLRSHKEGPGQNDLGLLRPRGVPMPYYETTSLHDDCRQSTRLPKILGDSERHDVYPPPISEATSNCLTGGHYATSSDISIDNVFRISDLTPRLLMDSQSTIRYNMVDMCSEPPSTGYRRRSHSAAETTRPSSPRDRKYLFVNQTLKDGKLISRGVQASGSWKTVNRRKKAACEEERKIAKVTTKAVSKLKDNLRRPLEQGLSRSNLMKELGLETQKSQTTW